MLTYVCCLLKVTGTIDQLRSNLGAQKQLVPSSNQFQLLSPQQQLIAQAQTPNDLTRMSSPAPAASPNVRSDDPDYLIKVSVQTV
jgi:hypothetical protein